MRCCRPVGLAHRLTERYENPAEGISNISSPDSQLNKQNKLSLDASTRSSCR